MRDPAPEPPPPADTNKTPLAVRLARVVKPDNTMPFPWRWHGERVAKGYTDTRMGDYFSIHRLNDLALVEAKVIAAGLEQEYAAAIRAVWLKDGLDFRRPHRSRTCAVRTMKPEQITRALAAVLDANPERFTEAG